MSDLRPFFCYFGGKWRVARKYPAPQHAEIVEPFAGAAGYSTRYPDRQVTLYDKDPTIIGLWQYLIRVPAAEIRALPDIALDATVDDLGLACEEQKWLIGFWLNSGTSAPCKRPSYWMRKTATEKWETGGGMLGWGPKVRERIAHQVEQIRHWRAVLASYEQIPNRPASWFIDPPYVGAGTHYRCSSRSIDFTALGSWCADRQGQVCVCENEGATWLPFESFADIKGAGGKRRSGRSLEVVAYFPGGPG